MTMIDSHQPKVPAPAARDPRGASIVVRARKRALLDREACASTRRPA